jgi:hypothetical protein
MKKMIMLAALAMMLLPFLGKSPAFSQDDVREVNDPGFTGRTRCPVTFMHDAHNVNAKILDCGTCHHVYENGVKKAGETSEGRACSECHADKFGVRSLIKAYHGMCIKCHVERKAGPVQCGECHSRKVPMNP